MPPPASAKEVLLGSDAAASVELLLNLLTDAASQRDVSSGVSDVIQVRPTHECAGPVVGHVPGASARGVHPCVRARAREKQATPLLLLPSLTTS
jgi:hypothetical protein